LHFKVLCKAIIMAQENDIQVIRQMMERSSRVLTLSGLSGIFPGIFALLGSAYTWFGVINCGKTSYDVNLATNDCISIRYKLMIVAITVLIFSVGFALYFSKRKAKKLHLPFWDKTAKRMLYNLLLPIVTGGIFTGILVWQDSITMVASSMLIFYGIGLINASKYTHKEIHFLGVFEIVLGLFAGIFLNYGLLFWTIGFGVLHIVYGTIMYNHYDK